MNGKEGNNKGNSDKQEKEILDIFQNLSRPDTKEENKEGKAGMSESVEPGTPGNRLNSENQDFPQEKVPTGISGFDELVLGGLRKSSMNIMEGGAGSGKSIFCMEFLIHGIERFNENGIFVSFEESEEELLKSMEEFGWNLRQKIRDNKLAIVFYEPEQVERVIVTGGGPILDIIESINAKRIVIDSLSAYTMLYRDKLQQRKVGLKLFEAVRKWNCTALLTVETDPGLSRQPSIEEFEVDGVILLYHSRTGNVRERSIEILKMKGVKHSNKIHPLKITGKGIQIYPLERVF